MNTLASLQYGWPVMGRDPEAVVRIMVTSLSLKEKRTSISWRQPAHSGYVSKVYASAKRDYQQSNRHH